MINKRKLVVLLLFSFILISSFSAISAADSNATDVQTVDSVDVELEQTDSDSDVLSATRSFSDLNDLINSSTSSEIVLEDDYTYNYNINDDNSLVVARDDIVIDGNGHTIKGGRNTKHPAYGFKVSSKNVVIKNINFVDIGSVYQDRDGGAILADSTMLKLKVINCTFKYCYGKWGGAVSDANTIEDCTFEYCYGKDCGGAVFGSTVINSIFSNCQAFNGGAIYQSSAYNCTFTDNYAGEGGAAYMAHCVGCIFEGNSASYGGAVRQAYSNDAVINCTFKNNEASSYGGALYSSYSLYDAINCTFEGNTAYNYAVSKNAHLVLCTFKDNSATNGLMYESGSIKTPTLTTNASSFTVTCPDQIEIPINYVYDGCSGKYYFPGIDFAFTLSINYSYDVIATYECKSGSSLTLSLNKGKYLLRNKSPNNVLCYLYVNGEKTSVSADSYTEMFMGEDKYLSATLVDSQNIPMQGYTVYLTENGNALDALTTDEFGQVSFSLKNIPAGVHNLNVAFSEDARHEASSAAVTVAVNKFPTLISADDVSGFASDDLKLIAKLTDENGNPLQGFGVYLTENGNVLKYSTTDASGQATFSVNDLTAGSHNLNVESAENGQYASSSAPVNVVITKVITTIYASDISVFIDDEVSLDATLLDENGNPMMDRSIYLVEGNNVRDVQTTDASGKVTFNLNGLSAGEYNYNLVFGEEKLYAGANLPVSVEINNIRTTLAADNIRTFLDEGIITAKLTDEYGNPLVDTDVTLDLVYIHRTVRTDANGEVQFNLRGLAEGSYDGTVSFAGNRTHKAALKDIHVELYKLKTNLYVDNITFVYGESGILTATLRDDDGNPIEDADVKLKIYSTYQTLKTDANGEVRFDLTNKLSGGTTEADVIVENTNRYTSASSHISITVGKIPTAITAPDIVCTYGEGNYLVATLKDKYGNPIRNVNLAVKINSISLSGKTDENGQAKFFMNLPPNTYSAKISYSGNNIYESSSATANIQVNIVIEVPVENPAPATAGHNGTGVEKTPTKIIAEGFTEVYNDGKDLVITLKDDSGNALANEQLTIEFNGKTGKYDTDKNGQVKLPTASLVAGSYVAKISFAGDDNLKGSSANANVVIKKASVKMTTSKKKLKLKSKRKFTVTLKNNKNAVMKGVKVSIKIKGKLSIVVKTNSKGKAVFKLSKLTKKGKYKAVITYSGDNCYNGAVKTVKIKIK